MHGESHVLVTCLVILEFPLAAALGNVFLPLSCKNGVTRGNAGGKPILCED